MISLILIFILSWQFYIGYARGFVLQVYYSLSAVLAFIVASFYYKRLADALTLWVPYASPTEDARMSFFQSVNIFELDRVFYAGVAFLMLYLAMYVLFRFLGLFMHVVDVERFEHRRYQLVAGLCELGLTTSFMTMLFKVLVTIPLPIIQDFFGGQWLLRLVIHLPGLSQLLDFLWVTSIL